jgi:hypothetical protein
MVFYRQNRPASAAPYFIKQADLDRPEFKRGIAHAGAV